jgi:hypothetical protein
LYSTRKNLAETTKKTRKFAVELILLGIKHTAKEVVHWSM